MRVCAGLKWWRLLALLVGSTVAVAGEQRVLLSFDGSGHRVEKVLFIDQGSVPATRSAISSGNAAAPDLPALLTRLSAGFAILVWLDEQGMQQATTRETDPRLSHAPSHIDGASKSRLGSQDGAWLVSGPAAASDLLVLLPTDPSVGLALEMWNMSLKGY